jgi:hypothetical protein
MELIQKKYLYQVLYCSLTIIKGNLQGYFDFICWETHIDEFLFRLGNLFGLLQKFRFRWLTMLALITLSSFRLVLLFGFFGNFLIHLSILRFFGFWCLYWLRLRDLFIFFLFHDHHEFSVLKA